MKDIEARVLVNNRTCLEETRLLSKLGIKMDGAKKPLDISYSCKADIEMGRSVYVGVGGNRKIGNKGDPLEDIRRKCRWH